MHLSDPGGVMGLASPANTDGTAPWGLLHERAGEKLSIVFMTQRAVPERSHRQTHTKYYIYFAGHII